MAQSQFVHLHAHSEYSLLDGACRIKQMVKRAAEMDMPALALTDHGVMYGAIQFYEEAINAGIKPIIGCEVYVARSSRFARDARRGKEKDQFHLLLLAQNETGYKNLMKLVTEAHLNGYYYKPRVDREILEQNSEGLICLSSCLAGEVAQNVMDGQDKEALRIIEEHQAIFGKENYYLEIQDHDIHEQKLVNEFLLRTAERMNAPLVATNDIHYLNADDADPHDVLLCIQTGTTKTTPGRMKFDTHEFYMKDLKQMQARFRDFPGALERTVEIADRCNLKLDFGRLHLPDLPIPDGRTPEEHLTIQSWEGLERRYPNASPEIRQRMEYELDTIIKCGFAKYLLIVQDFARFANNNKILAGVRGSAAGSIVCYCLGITNVDPMFHKLTFERFLNVERIQMPDVDFDFQDDRRDEVIDYVSEQYGKDHVAQIITFGTLGAKAAIRDSGRALEMPLSEVDRIAKMIPSMPVGITIEDALKENPDLKAVYTSDEKVRELIDMAKKLEGISRHASTHAAGVIVSKDPLVENVPLQRSADGGYITQYDMDAVGKIGLLKMDFLGLINLSIIQKCINLVKENLDIEIDLHGIPKDDEKAYDILGRAETTGLFQLESAGMRRYIKELKPQSISELAAMVALYRPGPMAHIPQFINAKFGKVPIVYMHQRLESILAETYGVIVYQDQVMQIVQAIAGFSLGHADILRRAMGKKDPEKMAKEREHFVQGALDNGVDKETSTKIFDLIEPFAGYAFNKAHAVCYGTVAYQTAYLKAHYPVEYLTAILACHAENQDRVALYVEEARRLGIEILPPDVNHSRADFSIGKDGRSIRFGMSAIKNCGRGLVDAIVEEREKNGEYKSLSDFIMRAGQIQGFNRAAMECLAKVGALDSLHKCRKEIVECAEAALAKVSKSKNSAVSAQVGLFGAEDASSFGVLTLDIRPCDEYPRAELLAMEKDLLGLYISDHPLNEHSAALKRKCDATVATLNEFEDGQVVSVGGVITAVKQHITKKSGEKMAFVTLEDLTGVTRVTIFPRTYAASESLIQRDSLVIIKGKIQHTDPAGSEDKGPAELVCEEVLPLVGSQSEAAAAMDEGEAGSVSDIFQNSSCLTIRLTPDALRRLPHLKHLFDQNSGDGNVYVKIGDFPDEKTIRLHVKVAVSTNLAKKVQDILGADALAMACN